MDRMLSRSTSGDVLQNQRRGPQISGEGLLTLTLDNGQQDDDDEEEEGDVEDDTVKLVLVARWVLNLIANAPAGTHPDIHVEQVTLF